MAPSCPAVPWFHRHGGATGSHTVCGCSWQMPEGVQRSPAARLSAARLGGWDTSPPCQVGLPIGLSSISWAEWELLGWLKGTCLQASLDLQLRANATGQV